MKKGYLLLILSFAVVLNCLFVTANNIGIDGKNYSFVLNGLTLNSAHLTINGIDLPAISKQSSPPYYLGSNAFENLKELKLVLTNAHVSSKVTDFDYATLIIATERNVSELNPTLVNIDGKDYSISLRGLTSSSVYLTINGIDLPAISPVQQTSPYYFYSNNFEGLKELKFVLTKTFVSSKVTDFDYATLFVAVERNISEECAESWTCSDWSECLDNQQTRTCTDSNFCGTMTDKPSETQTCDSPNPSIACTENFDCAMEATGSPYCDGNQVCIGSISYRCINPGTLQSYCNSTSIKHCNPCPEECQDNQCVNKSQVVKECQTIGLRQSGKYCSAQYKLIIQKASEISCENNFECKTNSCLDSICGEDKHSNLIYWIIGVVAIIVIVSIIFYFLNQNK